VRKQRVHLGRSFRLLLVGTVLALAGGAALAEAPPGKFEDLAGKPAAVADYFSPDRWLVLMIWAADCHVCNMEVESYAMLHEAQKDKRLRLLGLSIDGAANVADARDFVKRHDVPFPNLIGDAMTVGQYYTEVSGRGFMGTPSFVIFRPDGTPAASQAGAVPGDVIVEYIESQSTTQ
jgi:peroxiredoxin